MKNKSNTSSKSAMAGLNSIVNSQNDSLTSRVLQSNYSKKDLTISNSTSNLSQTLQQYQQQLSSSSQQANSNQRPKYFLNNSSNGLPQSNISYSLEKKSTGNLNYFFKNGVSNTSQLQQQYIQQQLSLQQKSFDSIQRQNGKSESNSTYLQNRVKTSRSIVNYNLPDSNTNKLLPNSSRNLSPLTLNQLDQNPPFLRTTSSQQENNFAKNVGSKSPSSNKNNLQYVNAHNNNSTQNSKNSCAPLNKILTPNVNLSNIFKSTNQNHLLLSNAVKKSNTSLTNLNVSSQQQNNQNQQFLNIINNENRIQPLSSLVKQERSKLSIATSQNVTQRTERTATQYEESDPKKQKIVENIIENILNAEQSIQEPNNQIGLYEENRNLQNNQKRLTTELDSLKNANEILGKENQELKEAIKAEREKFKDELTKQLYEINNLKQCEELYKNEKSQNEKYSQNLQVLEESFMNYKNDIVGLIYDTFEIVLTTKGFNTHLKSVQLTCEEKLEVHGMFLSTISKKSSDLMNKLNPFVVDLDIQNQLKDVFIFLANEKMNFGNEIKNIQKTAFYESLQNYNEKNKNCMQEINHQAQQKEEEQENLDFAKEDCLSLNQNEDLEIVLNDFEDDRNLQTSQQKQHNSKNSIKHGQSEQKHQQSELTNLKSILTSTMSNNNYHNRSNSAQNDNPNNNSIKIKSIALEIRSNQEISCQYSQDQIGSSIQSSRIQQHKSSYQEKGGVKLQDYISFNTNDNITEGQNQMLNIIQEEETPSKPNQNPLDQFLLVTSNYKPNEYQLDLLKDKDLEQELDEIQERSYNNMNRPSFIKSSFTNQQDHSNIQDNSILSSNYNLPKQIPIQPKNFMLQLVSPSSDSSQRHIFDQSKQLQDSRSTCSNSKIVTTNNYPGLLTSQQQHQFDPQNKLSDLSRISNISSQSNNANILSSLKSQTANNIKTITNTVINQKNVSTTALNAASKHKQQESIESQGINDGQLSSGQNTVIYHHSKQVSQLSQYTQSNHKNFPPSFNQPITEEGSNNKNYPSKDKEVDLQELSPCFSSSRVHDLDNSNSMNPLDIHKKQNQQTQNLIQNKHLNQNSIHYHPQQIPDQPQYNQIDIHTENGYFDHNSSRQQLDYVEESPDKKNMSPPQAKQHGGSKQSGKEQSQQNNSKCDNKSHKESSQQHQKNGEEGCKIDSTMSGDEFVIAEYNFKAQKVLIDFQQFFEKYNFIFNIQENDLEFTKGDKIQVLKRTQNGWWIGLCRNRIGYFPFNFVSEIKFS